MRLVLLIFVACRLPHVEPLPRAEHAQRATLAEVHISCVYEFPFRDHAPDMTPTGIDYDSRRFGAQATGVVISERHILTAAHAVTCGEIPGGWVMLSTGWDRVAVERDDKMFPHGDKPTDVARLEKYSAGSFDLAGIVPPVIRDALGGEPCCAETLHGRTCGTIDPYHRGVVEGLDVRKGDSGAPLYCEDGALVGLVVNEGARFESLDSYWLEGT